MVSIIGNQLAKFFRSGKRTLSNNLDTGENNDSNIIGICLRQLLETGSHYWHRKASFQIQSKVLKRVFDRVDKCRSDYRM